MNGLRTWVFKDVVQVISKRPLQGGSFAYLHNSSPSGRFWSSFEFSKRDGQSLYKTKENDSPESHGNFQGTILAVPRPHILELPIGCKETQKDVSNFNLKLKDLRNNNIKAIGDGSQKPKIENIILKSKEVKVEKPALEAKQTINDTNKNAVIQEGKAPILQMTEAKSELPLSSGQKSTKSWYDTPPIRPSSIAPKNCPSVPQRPEFNTKPKKISPMNNSDQSKVFRKKHFSKSCTQLSKLSFNSKENNLSSSSMKVEKSASFAAKEKGKSSLSLKVSVEVPRLRTTKSLPDQIVSRYSSGVAKSGLFENSKKSGSGSSRSWNQVANMSCGKKKKNKKEKKSRNNCPKKQECPPPCPPPPPPCCPPPPPPCCPPPPPPCCPEKEVKKVAKKPSCPPPCPPLCPPPPPPCCPPPPPPCCPPPPPPCCKPPPKCEKPKNMKKKKKNKCDEWCPDIDPYECYTSKCGKKKKLPLKPRICPPTCFEPEECPKAFCVDPNKKGSKGKCFSTWTHRSSAMLFSSRSFASDACKPKNKGNNEEKFNRRIPKPGPACKAKSGNKCHPPPPVKKSEPDKCKEPPKKSCQPSSISAKEQQLSTENLVRREFEEVQKCKEGRKETKSENKCKDETSAATKSAKKTTAPTGLERVISPCKLERMKKSACKNQEATCKMISVDDSLGSSYKNLLGNPQRLQSDFTEFPKMNNLLPIEHRSETPTNGIKLENSYKGKDLRGSFFAQNIINDQIPRNKSWLSSWFQ